MYPCQLPSLFESAMRYLQAERINNRNFLLLDMICLYCMLLLHPYNSTMTYFPLILRMRKLRPRGGHELPQRSEFLSG